VTRVTFAFGGPQKLTAGAQLVLVASKNVPAGSYAVVATVSSTVVAAGGDNIRDLVCELHAGNTLMGKTTDRRLIPDGQVCRRSLTLNGGTALSNGGTINLFCGSESGDRENVDNAQLMITQIDGFF
jgi:hypothetical protein